MRTEEKRRIILQIIAEHRRVSGADEGVDLAVYSPALEAKIDALIDSGQPIRFVMPGFPQKCPVRSKTLSNFPDNAEAASLTFLNSVCEEITRQTGIVANMCIYPEGFMFKEDLWKVADRVPYHVELQSMIHRLRLAHVQIIDVSHRKAEVEVLAETEAVFKARICDAGLEDAKNQDYQILYNGLERFCMEELVMDQADQLVSSSQIGCDDGAAVATATSFN